jgi:hypothetical protein
VEIAANGQTVYGTAFLIAPDLVITNHHVVAALIDQTVPPAAARFRFDYKQLGGSVLSQGRLYGLHPTGWLVDQSPPSAVDLQPEPKAGSPKPDELDYAVLRLSESAGSDPPGAKPDPNAAPRGWMLLADPQAAFAPGDAMLILQHPEALPMKLAIDMAGTIGPNGNGTRVKYKVNTEAGSSGSPCFDANWKLVALHHSGDPNFDPAGKPAAYNEGIPIRAVLALLTQRNKAAALGK